jgi:hypothetical protein
MIALLTAVMFTIFAYQDSLGPTNPNYTIETTNGSTNNLTIACGKGVDCVSVGHDILQDK